jgi:nucleotide-binding universal stress UspA family protein
MNVHLTLVGTLIAFAFLASVVSLIVWMLHLPEQTPTSLRVARAVRLAQRANRILVPVQGSALSDRMVAVGAQMAKARGARLEVFSVIEVPWMLPLDARLPGAEEAAREAIARASRITSKYGVPVESQIVNARDAGRAIVEESEKTGADIILMGDLPNHVGETRFSNTTTYVFSHALCEVIIDRPAVYAFPGEGPKGSKSVVEVSADGR